ncbi:MAG: ATP-binding protein [Bacteroidales bacterium]|nr:ATP-binding protein [Bacteroidales bacterium]
MKPPVIPYQEKNPLTQEELATMSLLDKLEVVIEIARNCKLEDAFFKKHEALIQSVAETLNLTPMQTVLFSIFVNNVNNTINEHEIANFLSLTPIAILKLEGELKTLFQKHYIAKDSYYDGTVNYGLHSIAKKALCKGEGLPEAKTTNLTPDEFMDCFANLLSCYLESAMKDFDSFTAETMELIESNPNLAIVKALDGLPGWNGNKVIMLCFCLRLVKKQKQDYCLDKLDNILGPETNIFIDEIESGTHSFIKEKLIIPYNNGGLSEHKVYTLTDKARKQFLREFHVPKYSQEQANGFFQIIKHQDIKAKQLFYSEEDEKQVETLKKLMQAKKLKTIQKCFEEAHMPKGFSCLFYGSPGTGKTETVLQLAKATRRDVLKVDISSTRSAWYGETEKNIKEVFDYYALFVRQSKQTPILLINEADALLSVRAELSGNNNIEKIENNIQNIILDEMEHLEGIMIATTNLTCNLDAAFDRRFLYKIQFHQPSIKAKTHIWQHFLPELNEEEALLLARDYDFSGGQIENVRRKVFVNKLLFSNQTKFSQIQEFCAQECISDREKGRNPIGFKK